MKIVHAADLHLDSPMRGLERYEGAPIDQLRGATRRAFTNLVDHCIEQEAALLLLAGDLYDGDWRDYATGLFFAGEMSRLRRAGVQVALSRRETGLLKVFLANPHIPLTREEIAAALDVTGEGGIDEGSGRAIDVLVGRLRSKIEQTPKDPRMLRTERGTGYVFAVDVETGEG